jgi:hypothetical protein
VIVDRSVVVTADTDSKKASRALSPCAANGRIKRKNHGDRGDQIRQRGDRQRLAGMDPPFLAEPRRQRPEDAQAQRGATGPQGPVELGIENRHGQRNDAETGNHEHELPEILQDDLWARSETECCQRRVLCRRAHDRAIRCTSVRTLGPVPAERLAQSRSVGDPARRPDQSRSGGFARRLTQLGRSPTIRPLAADGDA